MVKQKYYLALTTEEWRLMIECLNKLRNRLISEGRCPLGRFTTCHYVFPPYRIFSMAICKHGFPVITP